MRAGVLRLVPLAVLSLSAVVGCKNTLNYAPPGGPLACSDPGAICSVGYDDVGDGGPALAASLVDPTALAYDAAGNLYIADRAQNRIRRVDAATGTITTIAGTGEESYSLVEGRPADETIAGGPIAVAVTDDGTVFWADDESCVIYAISPTSGTVSVAAGGYCSGGGGITPDDALFDFDGGSRLRARGNDLVIASTYQNQIRYWNRGSAPVVVGGISVAPGTVPNVAYALDTHDAAVASDGTIYVVEANYDDCRIRRYSPAGALSYVVGNGGISTCGSGGDGGPATSAQLNYPSGIVLDENAGVLVVADNSGRLRAVNLGNNQTFATVVFGTGGIASIAGDNYYDWLVVDGGLALDQLFRNTPTQPVFDPNGDLVVADPANNVVRRINVADGTMSVIAGFAETGTLEGFLNAPASLALLPDGDLLVAGRSARVWRLSGDDREPFFGNGNPTYSGDGGVAVNAGGWATGVTSAEDGRVFIADAYNHRVRVVDPLSGTISTVAGDGGSGQGGDGGLASSASFDGPHAVVVDSSGNLFISDYDRIRYVNFGLASITVAGIVIAPQSIETVAGGNGQDYFGDGGPATAAGMNLNNGTEIANGMAIDGRTLFFADSLNNRIRAVDLDTGTIETVVGSGAGGSEAVGRPGGIAIQDGWLYWAQNDGNLVKRLDLDSAEIQVIAGDGNTGYYGEGLAAEDAQLIDPAGLVVTGSGTVYVTDLSHRVRRIIP